MLLIIIIIIIIIYSASNPLRQGCRKMFCYGGAPVTHGCRGKDASHMKRGNCTISSA